MFTTNHKKEIFKCTTFKDAHLYCVVNNLSAQQFGKLLESYIIEKTTFKRVKGCQGDCVDQFGNVVEIKISLGGQKRDKFNFVQLRPGHDIGYYLLTAFHLTPQSLACGGDLYVFRVPNTYMKKLVIDYGTYAHGPAKRITKILKDVEYALRPRYGSDCWNELMKWRARAPTQRARPRLGATRGPRAYGC